MRSRSPALVGSVALVASVGVMLGAPRAVSGQSAPHRPPCRAGERLDARGWCLHVGGSSRPVVNAPSAPDAGTTEPATPSQSELARRCNAGTAAACGELAQAIRDAQPERRRCDSATNRRIVTLATRACSANDDWGCVVLAGAHIEGLGVRADSSRALEIARAACDHALPYSCQVAANLLATPMPSGGADPLDATEYQYIANAPCGAPDRAPVTPDDNAALLLHLRACAGHDWASCSWAASRYGRGAGVQRDEARAVVLYQQACDGDPLYCGPIAYRYAAGRGVARDPARALQYFQRMCDRYADSDTCFEVGAAYFHGRGTARDEARARSVWQASCRAGHAPSCTAMTAPAP